MANSADKDKLTLEKLEIHARLLIIEEYLKEGKVLRHDINETLTKINVRCQNVEYMIHGEPASSDKIRRDGINRRVEGLESFDQSAKDSKKNFLKIATGAITLAVGSFVLWLGKLIWSALGK